MIKITNVDYTYPGEKEKAIQNINLQIDESTIYAVIGPNGSGKSTLVELLDGLILPDSGEILIDDLSTKNENELTELRRKLSVNFQNPDNQIVGMTVERDIAFGLENLGLSREEMFNRIEEVLKITGLQSNKNDEPHNLSVGQKQKLAFASVLAMRPKYLILDEPAAMLDGRSQIELVSLIKKMNNEKKTTVLFTTHSLDMALHADEIVLLDNGCVKAVFKRSQVVDNFSLLEENGIDLPFWARLAFEIKKSNLSIGTFEDMKSFGESLCLSLKK